MKNKRRMVFILLLGLCLHTACGKDADETKHITQLPVIRLGDGQIEPPEEVSPSGTGSSSENNSFTENTIPSLETIASKPVSEGGNSSKEQSADTSSADITEPDTATAIGPTEEPETPAEIKITVSAAGDVTMGNYRGQGYESSFRYTYDQGVGDSYFFENVVDIFREDDLTLVNLEGPLTRAEEYREGQTYCISGDPEYVNILTEGSVEAVSMGNNHRLDYLEQGSADTASVLEEAGILYAYDDNYCMYEARGIHIGIISVNEVAQGYLVENYIKDGIARLREQEADLVLVCCHWGIEREYYPEDYQKQLGRKCIDWGADLVIGHHPHVLQGVEEYEGKFIIYSLGNFCFGANRNPSDKDCMIFQQTFTFVDGEKQEDQEVRAIPCSVSSVPNRNDYKPTPAQGEEAQRILDKINECSRDFGVEFDSEGYLKKAE